MCPLTISTKLQNCCTFKSNMKYSIILLAMLPLIFSCKTKKITVEKTAVETNENKRVAVNEKVEEVIVEYNEPVEPEVSLLGKFILETMDGNFNDEFVRISLNFEDGENAKKFNGNDGCNSYQGRLVRLTDQKISFGEIDKTEQQCEVPAKFAASFYKNLEEATTFKIKNKYLILYNSSNQELLQFVKTR